jgi:alanine dehydrogenase
MGEARNGRQEGRRKLGALTIILSEEDVCGLLDMDEVVEAVEEVFRRVGKGEAINSVRTRSREPGSVLNVMHATLPYLQRGGLKAYMTSRAGTKFVVALFDGSNSAPLAVMGADNLGRFRTGAASGVATKHLYGKNSGTLAVLSSGKQALTQALAIRSVMTVDEARVWSPNPGHRDEFSRRLRDEGFRASTCDTPDLAFEGADVACSITSSKEPFITEKMLGTVSHVNICGGNIPEHAEITSGALGTFGTLVVDDLPQAKIEYGDLIQAVRRGDFTWDSAVDLGSIVAGRVKPSGRTLFKSGGVAIEDVAVASMLYDKAMNSGKRYSSVELF